MIRQVLAGLLCVTPMTSPLFFFVEAAVASPQKQILPTSSPKVVEPAIKQLKPYGDKVLPPTAKVQGYSLDDMAQVLAYFTKAGNNLAYRLYLNGETILNLLGEPFISQFTYEVTVK